jgi:hypothetical protein
MTPYESFIMYSALKLHFGTEKFDYFKYNRKVNVAKDTFEKRKDKYDFVKLSRKYSDEEMELFFVSNFLVHPKAWSKELITDEANDCFVEKQKILQSLSYVFKNDIEMLKEKFENLNDMLKVSDNTYPPLLKMTFQKDVHLETFIILDSILKFVPIWNKKINDTFRWPDFSLTCKKYTPFLSFETFKFRKILKEQIATC